MSYTITGLHTAVLKTHKVALSKWRLYVGAGVTHVFASLIGFADLGVSHLSVYDTEFPQVGERVVHDCRDTHRSFKNYKVALSKKELYIGAGELPIIASLFGFADHGVSHLKTP